ncbi:hypothetical protein CDAR_54291 [Caerostris darwini]|uniref:Uncharacterized protein n=1 Tax=Caerostris darwini TaxID=1538125 RepID=A0AAV4WPB8_9ARAC|nr:hypothetical protein CDAR_54291 [Caerostris darwini]
MAKASSLPTTAGFLRAVSVVRLGVFDQLIHQMWWLAVIKVMSSGTSMTSSVQFCRSSPSILDIRHNGQIPSEAKPMRWRCARW